MFQDLAAPQISDGIVQNLRTYGFSLLFPTLYRDLMRPNRTCPICTSPIRKGLDPWHFVCPTCGYEFSTLERIIRCGASEVAINEAARAAGLKTLRERNFKILIDQLGELGLASGASVLDVGCAHGWFLHALSARGYKSTGLEPDRTMVAIAKSSGENVREGFFPEALPVGERYDAITFNDVFEHLPRVDEIARHCFERLNPGGFLLINAPNTAGIFYQLAKLLRRLGVRSVWERMWQKGLPSPHLSYFSTQSLREIARRTGFSEVVQFNLLAEQAQGSWHRIRYTGIPLPAAAAIWCGLLIARPVLILLPSDIVAFVFRKP
jgi:2-polyprenyl-3-methyl-5-hydroxy-6-metoxy-1,4-benzoquinol methylase